MPIGRSRPLQALLMTRATAEAQARRTPQERAFTITRAGPPGIQRYAQTWSGDNTTSWHTLRWNIRMGLTMSLSGMFNVGHDIGGFAGPTPDPELLLRWVQAGLFSPRFIMNSWKADGRTNTPWLHPGVLAPIRDAIRLRYRLIPYLYSLFRRASVDGEPILRPLFYDFPADDSAFEDTDAFMVGPSMLVAPVVEPGARRKRVYLPRGPRAWVDFWSGRRHAAGNEIVVDAPLERMPLLVPEGAIVPLTDTVDFSRLHDEPSRQVRVFPAARSGASAFVLYEDDGISHAYAKGDYAEVALEVASTPRTITVSARRTGGYRLPYDSIRVVLPEAESRRLVLRGTDINLFTSQP
jgi:alpha-glucosidase